MKRTSTLLLAVFLLFSLVPHSWGATTSVPKTQELSEEVKQIMEKAKQGDAGSQQLLGDCYHYGTRGLPHDDEQALYWYRKAADQGFAEGQVSVGLCYKDGNAVSQNYGEAMKWFRKAAGQSYPHGFVNIGLLYKEGLGVNKDAKEAVRWFRMATDKGNAYGYRCLGVCYLNGEGVPRDYDQALDCFRKGADKGDVLSKMRLSMALANKPLKTAEWTFDIACLANDYEYTDWFSDLMGKNPQDLALVKTKGYRYGMVDKTGREVIPCHFLEIDRNVKEGLVRASSVEEGEGWGFLNTSGQTVIPFIYKHASSFKDGLAVVEKNYKYGVIDKTGKVVVPFVYERIDGFEDGISIAVIRKSSKILDTKFGIINTRNEVIVPFQYDKMLPFQEGLSAVCKGGKWAYIDKSGREVLKLGEGIEADSFSEGLARINDEKTGLYGFIDKTGKIVIPLKYAWAESFKDGTSLVQNGKRVMDLKGLIDKNGKEVFPVIYEELRRVRDGYFSVKADKGWGIMDRNGNMVYPWDPLYVEYSGEGLFRVIRDGKKVDVDKNGKPVDYDKARKRDKRLVRFENDGFYGYKLNDVIVIPPIFKQASDFTQEGYAMTNEMVLSVKNVSGPFSGFMESAEKGDADAQYFLARYCFLKKKTAEGMSWLRKSAVQGLPAAQDLLASCYLSGSGGLEKDLQEAFWWELAAAKQSHWKAMANVGYDYAIGQGVEQDYAKAADWLKKAAIGAGQVDAIFNLAVCYENGFGVQRDVKEAARLYEWGFLRRDSNMSRFSKAHRNLMESGK